MGVVRSEFEHGFVTLLKMPSDHRDSTATSTRQNTDSAGKRCAFDVLSARPPKLPKPSKSGRASTGTTGKGGRPLAWYFQHFEPVDKEKYPDDATDLFGKKGRLFQDNALMACKMCKDQQDRFTCKHNPSTVLGNHLLKACEGFQESAHWRDPDVIKKLASMASKVLS
jgi:hypothetical protein